MFEQFKKSYIFPDVETYIDSLTMETHNTKHHAAYTKNFNKAVEHETKRWRNTIRKSRQGRSFRNKRRDQYGKGD